MADYYFKLPPITQLTISQQAALYEINQIALSGGPGTGKSVVSLWRHISNFENNKKSLLLTYTTTLAAYLRGCCASDAAKHNTGTTHRVFPDASHHEVIIDEAQDRENEYYQKLKNGEHKVSYGADDAQILYPEACSTQQELRGKFPSNTGCVLSKNYRNTQRIMQFAKYAFSEAPISQNTITNLSSNIGELPILFITNENKFEQTNAKQDQTILDIINALRSDEANIAILVPWKSHAKIFENVIKNKIEDFSIYYEDKIRFPRGCEGIKNVHITTFKSAKGLEFDTVIIPNFHKYKEVETMPAHLHLTWKDYFVATTRTRSNLYLISSIDLPELNTVTDKSNI